MNPPGRQLAALSELRQQPRSHDWRYLLGAVRRPCYVCGKRPRRGESYWVVNLHAARMITVCDRCRARV